MKGVQIDQDRCCEVGLAIVAAVVVVVLASMMVVVMSSKQERGDESLLDLDLGHGHDQVRRCNWNPAFTVAVSINDGLRARPALLVLDKAVCSREQKRGNRGQVGHDARSVDLYRLIWPLRSHLLPRVVLLLPWIHCSSICHVVRHATGHKASLQVLDLEHRLRRGNLSEGNG